MTVALYCPMKPPDHPVASGDREIARLIGSILDRLGEGWTLASRLSTWQREPDAARLADLERASAEEAERLIAEWHGPKGRPSAWITYHLYHKAPDLLGPLVAHALDLPYVVIEASRAKKRATGPWAVGFQAADRALAAADAVVAMHGTDRAGLQDVVPADRLFTLPPFIDTAPFARIERVPRSAGAPVRLLAVGMMRPGNKAACYRVLAEAMSELSEDDWTLTIAGDGEAAGAIRPLFDPARTTFLGAVDRDRLVAAYAAADLFVWPAVNEPFGLVFLEAQASGLAVVGGRSRGVPEIVEDGVTGLLSEPEDARAFAGAVSDLIRNPDRRAHFALAARTRALGHHDVSQATARLASILTAARTNHTTRAKAG